MLDLHKVAQALAAKRELMKGYDEAQSAAVERYRRELVEVAGLPRAELEACLAATLRPGARPSVEHDRCRGPVVPFGQRWANHEEARAWAREVLSGVLTIAVDGSQIAPAREYGVPVGAVQIGWFENPHDPAQAYVKDVSFEVLAPQELAGGDDPQAGSFPDTEVNLRRFEGECLRLAACMQARRDRRPRPVCLLDGSLIVSFAQHMGQEGQARYVRAVTGLLAASQEYRVPLVGYVDTSYASDLAAMLDAVAGRDAAQQPADGAILRPLMQWGDRSPAWICARRDALALPQGMEYYEQVGFVYLMTTAGNPPARLDFPRWLLDEGQLEPVLDVVRGECVIGNGYPYAAETADAVAVITAQERERFYAAFQRFANEEGLPLRFSRKVGSKLGRR
jgi:hypothetical protein